MSKTTRQNNRPVPGAFIFDLDGTLLDTLDDIAGAVNRVLRQQGFPEHEPQDYKTFVGDGAEMLIRRALPPAERHEKTIAFCLEAYQKDYGANWDKNTTPYAGIPNMLDAIHRTGLKMGVFSNKPHAFTVNCVERFLSKWKFVMVIGNSGRFPKKPDPAGALAIAHSMQEDPKRIVFMGDSATDMQTAVGADMFPLGAAWGFRPVSELMQNGCRFLARRPMDVIEFLVLNPASCRPV
jgi:phosphoglycolate phosphatase